MNFEQFQGPHSDWNETIRNPCGKSVVGNAYKATQTIISQIPIFLVQFSEYLHAGNKEMTDAKLK